MADHGLIKTIEAVLRDAKRPLSVKEITALVDERNPIPFVPSRKQPNIHSLLAMEIHKERPRWQRVSTGMYAPANLGVND